MSGGTGLADRMLLADRLGAWAAAYPPEDPEAAALAVLDPLT